MYVCIYSVHLHACIYNVRVYIAKTVSCTFMQVNEWHLTISDILMVVTKLLKLLANDSYQLVERGKENCGKGSLKKAR